MARRTWLLLAALVSGLCSGVAVLLVPVSLTGVTIALTAASTVGMMISSVCGTLLNSLPANVHGRASGWYQGANIGAGAVVGSLMIWMADRVSLPVLSLTAAALVLIPAASGFLVAETPHPRRSVGTVFHDLFRDLWVVIRSRRTWVGLCFLVSPVGSAALQNLISGLGPDYHANASEVALVTGTLGGLIAAGGCFLGGVLANRMSRMRAYALAGGLSVVFSVYMGFGPRNEWTYGAGYSGYQVSAGAAYAIFTALVLEIMGKRRHAASTSYSLLVASGNLPIVYMTWLDGVGYKRAGVRGLMGVDAAANGCGALILLLLAVWAQRRLKSD